NQGNSTYRVGGVDVVSADGGSHIGWSNAGEWLRYTINVAQAGTYRAVLRAGSGASGGTARLRFSGGEQSELITVTGTGDWVTLANFTSAPFDLPAGVQVMEFDYVQAPFDLDSIELQLVAPANNAPTANAGGPYTINQGSALTLDGSGSVDPDSGDSIVSYAWDLNNDGTFGDVTGVNTTVTSAQLASYGVGAGSHTIGLRVTDSHGSTGMASTTVTVRGTQTITFGAIANHTYGDVPFTLSATASSGLPVT